MGWDFTYNTTKSELVKELLKPFSTGKMAYETLRYKLTPGEPGDRGHLWAVIQATDTETGKVARLIMLYLLQYENIPGHGAAWGYKGMSEQTGPRYYDCPVEFLKLAQPLPEFTGYSAKWRNLVLDEARVLI